MPLLSTSILTGGSTPGVSTAQALGTAPSPSGLPGGSVPYPSASGGASIFGVCHAFPTTPGAVLASLTDGGRNLLARMLVEGLAFRLVGFRVGSGGFNPSAPASPLPIDPALTELLNPFFPLLSAAPEPIDKYEYANAYAPAFLCRCAAAEAVTTIGEWGVYAEITASPLVPAEVGDRHLFAVCHRPMVGKTLNDVLVWRLVVQY